MRIVSAVRPRPARSSTCSGILKASTLDESDRILGWIGRTTAPQLCWDICNHAACWGFASHTLADRQHCARLLRAPCPGIDDCKLNAIDPVRQRLEITSKSAGNPLVF